MKLLSIRKQLVLCGALVMASGVAGQSSELLSHYRERALDYNHDVKASQRSISASVEMIGAARADLLPKLSADASYRYVGNPTELRLNVPAMGAPLHFQGTHHQYGAGMTLAQPLYVGGRLLETIRRAEHYSSYASNQLELVKDVVLQQTDACYWSAVAQQELVQIAEEGRTMVQQLATVVQQRVEVGAADPNDLLMAQVKLNEAEYGLVQTQTLSATSLMALNSLLGVALDEQTELDTMVIPLRAIPYYIREDTLLRPEVRMALDEKRLSESDRALTDARYRPQVSIGAEGTYGSPGYNFAPDLNVNYGVYARVSVPILEWGKRGKERRAASHRIAMAEEGVRKAQQQMALDIGSSELALSQAVEQVVLTENSLRQAKENERRSLERYVEGRLSVLEVLQAQLYRQTAQVNFVQAKLGAQSCWSELQRARGIME